MTQKQRIEELEKKVAELELRLAVEEAKPVYPYYVWPYPNTTPYIQPYTPPYFTWTTTSTGDIPPNGTINGSI